MKALYAGSFDPITLGHIDLIWRLALFYNPFIVLVAHSPWKKYLFSIKERVSLVKESLKDHPLIEVDYCHGLIVDYAKKRDIKIFIRGVRALSDFEYELEMSHSNKKLFPESETFIAFASAQYVHCSSRIVKEIAYNGGDVSHLVSNNVKQAVLKKKLTEV